MNQTRILIYSRDRSMLDSMHECLKSRNNLLVTAMSTPEAQSLIRNELFGVLVLVGKNDMKPVLDLVRSAHQAPCPPACIIIGINTDRDAIIRALNAGCSYFLDYPRELEKLREIVDGLARKRSGVIPENGHTEGERSVLPIDEELSRRENEILFHLLSGRNNREISNELGISEKTVKNHLWKIYRKFKVESRTQLFNHLLRSCPCMSSFAVKV